MGIWSLWTGGSDQSRVITRGASSSFRRMSASTDWKRQENSTLKSSIQDVRKKRELELDDGECPANRLCEDSEAAKQESLSASETVSGSSKNDQEPPSPSKKGLKMIEEYRQMSRALSEASVMNRQLRAELGRVYDANRALYHEQRCNEEKQKETLDRLRSELNAEKAEARRLEVITAQDAAFMAFSSGSQEESISRVQLAELIDSYNMDLRSIIFDLVDCYQLETEDDTKEGGGLDIDRMMKTVNEYLIMKICTPFCSLFEDISTLESCNAFRCALSMLSSKYPNFNQFGRRCEAWIHWALIKHSIEAGKQEALIEESSRWLKLQIGLYQESEGNLQREESLASGLNDDFQKVIVKLCRVQAIIREAVYAGSWSLIVDESSGEVTLSVNE